MSLSIDKAHRRGQNLAFFYVQTHLHRESVTCKASCSFTKTTPTTPAYEGQPQAPMKCMVSNTSMLPRKENLL